MFKHKVVVSYFLFLYILLFGHWTPLLKSNTLKLTHEMWFATKCGKKLPFILTQLYNILSCNHNPTFWWVFQPISWLRNQNSYWYYRVDQGISVRPGQQRGLRCRIRAIQAGFYCEILTWALKQGDKSMAMKPQYLISKGDKNRTKQGGKRPQSKTKKKKKKNEHKITPQGGKEKDYKRPTLAH